MFVYIVSEFAYHVAVWKKMLSNTTNPYFASWNECCFFTYLFSVKLNGWQNKIA